MSEQLKLIIADDHPIFRGGLRQVIENEIKFKVIAEASDGETALYLIKNEKPEIVILDVNMPKMSGFEVAKELEKAHFAGEIVFLTMHSEEAMFNKAMSLGARGYVLKDSAALDIINCLHSLAKGQHYTSPAITTYLFKRAAQKPQKTNSVESLTPTERLVLRLIAEDKTSKGIAEELCISYRTVENHRYNICQKLDIKGSNALIKFALKHQNEI
jgi:DNA-binding NarL/FixJ family response regulator